MLQAMYLKFHFSRRYLELIKSMYDTDLESIQSFQILYLSLLL